MNKFCLTIEFQNSFIEAIKNDNIKSWYENQEPTVRKISDFLKKIVIPDCDRKEKALFGFICNSFLSIITAFWDPDVFQLKKRSKSKKLMGKLNPNQNIEKTTIEKFKKSLIKRIKDRKWSKFLDKYRPYFDKVINLARSQGILDIVVETKNKNQYNNFFDAEIYETSIITEKKNVVKSQKSNPHKTKMIPFPEEDQRKPLEVETKIPALSARNESITTIGTSNVSTQSEDMNTEFQRKLNAQNETFAEKLRKIREERERLNREAEEDMRQFRKESALRIQMFLRCIQLRIRWEEQEQEWGDWLKSVRTPVIRVKSMFMEFNDSRRNNDEEENRSDVMYLHKWVQIAYDKLTHEFESLSYLSDRYEDKLFLKVIQFRIGEVATKLCILMEELEEYQNTEKFYSTVNNLEKQIDTMEIPTTSKLRLICENASPGEYDKIVPPKVPSYTCVITEIQ